MLGSQGRKEKEDENSMLWPPTRRSDRVEPTSLVVPERISNLQGSTAVGHATIIGLRGKSQLVPQHSDMAASHMQFQISCFEWRNLSHHAYIMFVVPPSSNPALMCLAFPSTAPTKSSSVIN